jgi:hypothetical protein
MLIQVTKEDIARAFHCSSGFCPIAIALKRVLGLTQGVRVFPLHRRGGTGYALVNNAKFMLSAAANQFGKNFDQKIKVDPCILELYET